MMIGMHEEQAWARLEEERRSFADLLAGLDDAQWDTASLCEGWSVAEVATHITAGPTGTLREFAWAMVRARGRFGQANRLMVANRMHRPRSAIVADARAHADDRFSPPGMGWRAQVTDFLLHRLDVNVPLGLDAPPAHDLWTGALTFLCGPRATRGFIDKGLPELTLVATDAEWAHGVGPRVEGPLEALALAVSRRPTPRLAELAGPGSDTLRRWALRG